MTLRSLRGMENLYAPSGWSRPGRPMACSTTFQAGSVEGDELCPADEFCPAIETASRSKSDAREGVLILSIPFYFKLGTRSTRVYQERVVDGEAVAQALLVGQASGSKAFSNSPHTRALRSRLLLTFDVGGPDD